MAKSIRDVILSRVENTDVTYWEPFVGGCGSFEVIAPAFRRAVGSDIHPDLILMWQSVMDGWVPPTEVSLEQYQELRDSEPSALRGFAGFGGSFGGKWFGGYARGGYTSDGTPRNYLAETSRNVFRTVRKLENTRVSFELHSYSEIDPGAGDVVYCDPPYAETTEYTHSGFDSKAFWAWCEDQVAQGVRIFVSEYNAPEGWIEVFRKETLTHVGLPEDRKKSTEKLFTKL